MPRLLAALLLVAALLGVSVLAADVHRHHHRHQQQHHGVAAPAAAASRSAPASAPALLLQDLTSASGVQWRVSGVDDSGAPVDAAATVPGNVYLDLSAAGVLADGDPLYRDNDKNYEWVAGLNWTYTATFDLASAGMLSQYAAVQLECDGIDTVAALLLNGRAVGATNDMHLRYTFDVRDLLQATGNVLTVSIQSPLGYAAALAAAYPYPVPHDQHSGSRGEYNMIRKTASDFGWDWGPAFAGSGVWQPLRLVAFQAARLQQVLVLQSHEAQTEHTQADAPAAVQLRVQAFVRTADDASAGSLQGRLCVNVSSPDGSGREVASACAAVLLPAQADLLGQRLASLTLQVPAAAVQLWWPLGYGAQVLYPLLASYTDAAGAVSNITQQVGLRTTQLVRETGPAGQDGKSFYFRVNGVPVWLKGANSVPFSSFAGAVSDANVTSVLRALVQAGGNTLRVWGGGLYQRDAMYAFADAHGLLVWSEFSFACSMYPRDDAFLQLVRREVAHQTRRLAGHASILVFGGNNENEMELAGWAQTKQNRDLYLVDMAKLFIDTVRDQVLLELADTSMPFVTSSPSRGPLSEVPYTQLWGAPYSLAEGDMHHYDIGSDCTELSRLPRGRFISEFGFQSTPSLHSLAPVLDAAQGDLRWDSGMMKHRERGPGLDNMRAQAARHFPMTAMDNSSDPRAAFASWLYLSQAAQALCVCTSIDFWRRIKAETPGRTQGALYWQLNDVWQAPTWSSLEYTGGAGVRWKQLHHHVARAFAPLAATGYVSASNASGAATAVVYGVSDVNSALTGSLQVNVSS